jgi:nicotinate-nucleotide pyrophosphorylase (carboxylating)
MTTPHGSPLTDSRISRLVELALMEDIGMGDLTSDAIIDEGDLGSAEFLCKEPGIIAGLDVVALVFELCDHSITLSRRMADGQAVKAGEVIALADGSARGLLKGERTALNFIQRMSGIATATARYVRAVEGTGARITDTRKTVPGLRVLDKLAVRLGGGVNHRFGLDDMILVKDNHIVAAGGIARAVQLCREYITANDITARLEVETKNLAEVDEALTCTGIDRIMLDNFQPDLMRKAVGRIDHSVEVEASGGITLETIRAVAETGVDFISVGALTHSVKGLDISLELTHTSASGDHRH